MLLDEHCWLCLGLLPLMLLMTLLMMMLLLLLLLLLPLRMGMLRLLLLKLKLSDTSLLCVKEQLLLLVGLVRLQLSLGNIARPPYRCHAGHRVCLSLEPSSGPTLALSCGKLLGHAGTIGSSDSS